MSPPRRAALLLLLSCALACARPPENIQRDAARRAQDPALLGSSGPARDPALPERTYRVRAYADQPHRSQTPRWEERVRRQLARANETTAGRFGVTFELVDARPWNAQAPPAEPLSALVSALEALDPGTDVDLVLGYTASLPAVTTSQDQLGLARVLGRHVVLRGLESAEEDRATQESLRHLPDRKRELLALERRTHKETSVLLHEWGHTLGAPHAPGGLMHDDYSSIESDFAEESAAVISIGLKQRSPGLDDPEVRAAWAKEISAWLASEAGKALDEGARKFLAELAAAGAAEPGSVMGRADHEVMLRAVQQDRAGQHAEASETLRPLLERYPKHPRLHAVACQVQIHAGASDDAAWKICARAEELDPNGPTAPLFVADLAERRKDAAAAREALARARSVLEKMKDAPADHWSYLATLHRHRLEVSATEAALARAGGGGGAEEARDWARRTRRWVGLVPGAVPLEREGEYVREFQQAQLELEQGKYARASQRVAALEQGFAGAAGPLTLRCELRLRQGAGPRELKDCRAAIERYAESSHAQYLLGVALARSRDWPQAAAALERVVDLDSTIPDVWERLAEAYRASGDAKGAAALRERYERRFGKPPPFK